jgi:glycosyltransferase involved in cell wall biosynthesis
VVDLLGNVVEDGPYRICERGISVRPYDVDAFAAGLEELIKNRSLRDRLGRSGFEFVDHNYRKERLLEDIKDLYGELLNRERVAHSELRVAKYS